MREVDICQSLYHPLQLNPSQPHNQTVTLYMFGRLLGRLLLMPASRETQKAVEKEFRALEPLLLSQLPLAAKNKDMRDRQKGLKRNSRAVGNPKSYTYTPKGRKEAALLCVPPLGFL